MVIKTNDLQFKGKDQYWKRPNFKKNEMEALITNHVKEYVLTNTWYKICRETAS